MNIDKKTKIFEIRDIEKDIEKIKEAAEILKKSGIIAIPTETVYGLAANALDEKAVKKIFEAKGRPQDNPLIVHVSDCEMASLFVEKIPEKAKLLFETFSPGPLTIILKKTNLIPNIVSANLDTVAIRIPNHAIAQRLIKESKLPLAAPSANLSGKPSPTSAKHCIDDLTGKVDGIISAENCLIGVESTVISLATETPILLRPGYITPSQIEKVIGEIQIDKSVLSMINDNEKVSSPGMKYKHYAPKAQVRIIESDNEQFCDYVKHNKKDGTYLLCFDDEKLDVDIPCVYYGKYNNAQSQAKKLFSALRELDDKNAKLVFVRRIKNADINDEVSLAVYNRLIRAAAFDVIKL